ncbi:MAG: hypothetical protein MJ170_04510 [Alphaproteobacteria bacterium]|nr:hypothetical protein [Alphaproteobacteria bacterium]
MRLGFVISLILCAGVANAADDLTSAIENVRAACGSISNELIDMKTKAGINTAVTGVGTVAGGVALGTGIAKANIDKNVTSLEQEIENLKKLQGNKFDTLKLSDENTQAISLEIQNYAESIAAKQAQISELEKKSVTLGNVRTGTMAGATATNIAGAVIAGTNKVKGDLKSQIDECIAATKTLSRVKMQARIDNSADEFALQRADKIVSACSEWEYVDLSKIDNRATGALVSNAIGATTRIAGTVTSASANSKNVRDGDATKEKNLNTASNVLAGTTTVASATATIFNATQIKAIKQAASVADVCEGALK